MDSRRRDRLAGTIVGWESNEGLIIEVTYMRVRVLDETGWVRQGTYDYGGRVYVTTEAEYM